MEVKEHQGTSLRYLTIEPDGYEPDIQYPMIILLHGYGSHMGDLAGLSQAIDRRGYLYAMPNAPIPMQAGYGVAGYAWTSPSEMDGDVDEEAQHAEERLAIFFKEVVALYHLEPGQVVLGGFSQGGMMTYRWGLPNPHLFRGLAPLSGKIQDTDDLLSRLPGSRDQSIFVAHGTEDALIPVEEARRSLRLLREQGYTPDYREYAMGHEISQEVVVDVAHWVHGVLPPAAPWQGGR